ncbi:sensor domain-containing diguanylate cyclase [Magnetospirillum sp. 15-1]|uniref:sensor domain-containing diguanylate cyclase n=1 Tax=Magnetospirillum sp. 15-1 TaxID=1979370 RepID=UPI000BBC000A|nr:sensor domain-containing diguanylate cyclase [Magnetospirillum sp. 15-1]
MADKDQMAELPSHTLLEIIKVQTDISRLGVDFGAVMTLVADRLQDLTGAKGAIVELAEGDEMVYRAAAGIAQSQLGLRLNAGTSLSGLCIATGGILQCDDVEIDPRVDLNACRRVGVRSMVVAPLSHEGTTIGVLKIASPTPHAFSAQHNRVLELISGMVAAQMFHSARMEKEELYRLATQDALTGLANRALFYDRLRQRLAEARRRQQGCFGIVNFDMDGLKPINDQYGHGAGDAAICETARRIRTAARETDTVARLGGDEFAAILTSICGRDGIASYVDRMVETVRTPFDFQGRSLPLDCSYGVAAFPEDGTELETLMAIADERMYEVKRTRKHR